MPNRNEFGPQYGRHEDERWRGAGAGRSEEQHRDDDRSREASRYGARTHDRDHGPAAGRDDDHDENSTYSGSSSQRDYRSGGYGSHDAGQGYGWQGGYGDQGQSGYGGQYHRLSGRSYWQGRQTHAQGSYQGGYGQDHRDDPYGAYGQSRQDQYGSSSQGRDDRYGGQYGQSSYGQSGYGQSGYGQSSYAPSGYVQSGYAPSGYGQSGYTPTYGGREHEDLRRGDEHEHRGLLQRAGEWIERKIGKAPKGYIRSDDRIREDVCDRIMGRWEVDASDVEVQVKDGEVTLSGSVTERGDKRHIEDIAEQVLGVKDVTNHIKVKSGNEPRAGGDASRSTSTTTGTSRTRASS